jgi:hypothetical protein
LAVKDRLDSTVQYSNRKVAIVALCSSPLSMPDCQAGRGSRLKRVAVPMPCVSKQYNANVNATATIHGWHCESVAVLADTVKSGPRLVFQCASDVVYAIVLET